LKGMLNDLVFSQQKAIIFFVIV